MKVVYHLDPEDAPSDPAERVGWLAQNSQRLADDLILPLVPVVGEGGSVAVVDVYIDMALDQTMFGPLPKAYLVVAVEFQEAAA